ncbi:hypothetical protein D3C85_1418000 [compost metagenome]
MRQDHGIGALVIEQRRAAKIVEGHHFTDHDPVIAAVHLLVFLAVKTRRAIGEHRRTALARFELDLGEAIFLGPGEIVGEINLVRRQYVDREMACLFEHLVTVGAFVDAPQHQRRIEGYRVEAVGGHPDLAPGGGGGGHHGHPGGEIAQCPAKGAWVEGRFSGCTNAVIRHARLPDCFQEQS